VKLRAKIRLEKMKRVEVMGKAFAPIYFFLIKIPPERRTRKVD
jgi:hypothetical protein